MSVTVTQICQVTHAANRALQEALGENPDPEWGDAPQWQRESSEASARAILGGQRDPRAEHERWRAEREAQGWAYGPVKDAAAKTSPWLVPYDDLPAGQRAKDALRIAIVTVLGGDQP